MSWAAQPMLCLDTETTGVNPQTARIVTACAVTVGPEGVLDKRTWLVNPGVDIPAEATAIHGITTEHARANGQPSPEAVADIAGVLDTAWRRGLPVVAMNAVYDLTVLAEEMGRLGLRPLGLGPVLDPLVIDRALDQYRKGSRKLAALAAHYKVRIDGAHDSTEDALTAARVLWRQARVYPELAAQPLADLQGWQAEQHRRWAAGYEDYLRRTSDPHASIDGSWPIRPARKAATT